MIKITSLITNYLLESSSVLNQFISTYNNVIDSAENLKEFSLNNYETLQQANAYINKLVVNFYKYVLSEKKESHLFFFYSLIKQATGNNFLLVMQLIEDELKSNKVNALRENTKLTTKIESPKVRPANNKIFLIEKLHKAPMKDKVLKVRNSKFRGISKTGKRWQVLLMHKRRHYYGSYDNEIEAAQVYDFYALKHFGFNAKTNFNYSEEDRERILNHKTFNSYKIEKKV